MTTDYIEDMEYMRPAFDMTMEGRQSYLKTMVDENGWVKGYMFSQPYDQTLGNYFVRRTLIMFWDIVPADHKYRPLLFKNMANHIVRGMESKLCHIADRRNVCNELFTEENAHTLAERMYEIVSKTLTYCAEHPDEDKSKDIINALNTHDKGYYFDIGSYATELIFEKYIPEEYWEFE